MAILAPPASSSRFSCRRLTLPEPDLNLGVSRSTGASQLAPLNAKLWGDGRRSPKWEMYLVAPEANLVGPGEIIAIEIDKIPFYNRVFDKLKIE